jgi:hypothetical protein
MAMGVVLRRRPIARGSARDLRVEGMSNLHLKTRSTPMSEKPISPLRQRMIEDMAVRRFNESQRCLAAHPTRRHRRMCERRKAYNCALAINRKPGTHD